MQRISALDVSAAPDASKPMLNAVQGKLGMVPNLFKTLAHSPAVLQFYLKQSEALSGGVLPAPLREQLALVAAGKNACDYCASAHTLMGKGAGLKADEMAHNLRGRASDAKVQAALDFAKAIIADRGHVTDQQVQAVRDAGYSEAEVVEIIAHVGMNMFTNYFNHIAATVVDFPLVSTAAIS
ncbi:carboxymuconolactone decarboxylase family protein [Herbaspirillum sp. RTI4]|uniref:carboxymuconolactone decarboxylase family protein n=1 Tax=Herbaspirillum sp. RTI4 TaxID=3048640 RepID=UPI002AB491FA|nr:carboxymuconolactone decarboxylase family protein [Herbaspirillum sp. RTI4]MDY7577896.1 carboxymuconolactone decarboxylase family protein [Herbaspirillum sp. RTI4]MEA9981658.1 carboxymuconolactone decarboxylase family protein [Herbaspirillum sp. RTI4]